MAFLRKSTFCRKQSSVFISPASRVYYFVFGFEIPHPSRSRDTRSHIIITGTIRFVSNKKTPALSYRVQWNRAAVWSRNRGSGRRVVTPRLVWNRQTRFMAANSMERERFIPLTRRTNFRFPRNCCSSSVLCWIRKETADIFIGRLLKIVYRNWYRRKE